MLAALKQRINREEPNFLRGKAVLRPKLFLVWGVLVFSLAVVACAPKMTWVTPSGVPIKATECLWAKPSTPGEPEVCRAKEISENPRDIAQCREEGGRNMLFSMLFPVYSCKYPAADAGKACKTRSDCELACDADAHQCRAFSSLGRTIDPNGEVVESVE